MFRLASRATAGIRTSCVAAATPAALAVSAAEGSANQTVVAHASTAQSVVSSVLMAASRRPTIARRGAAGGGGRRKGKKAKGPPPPPSTPPPEGPPSSTIPRMELSPDGARAVPAAPLRRVIAGEATAAAGAGEGAVIAEVAGGGGSGGSAAAAGGGGGGGWRAASHRRRAARDARRFSPSDRSIYRMSLEQLSQANENTYLNHIRNGCLSTGVGVSLWLYGQAVSEDPRRTEADSREAHAAGMAFAGAGFLSVVAGSTIFIARTVALGRSHIHYHPLSYLWRIGLASSGVALWGMAIIYVLRIPVLHGACERFVARIEDAVAAEIAEVGVEVEGAVDALEGALGVGDINDNGI